MGDLERPHAQQVVPAVLRDAPPRQEELHDEHRDVGGDERHRHHREAARADVVVERDHAPPVYRGTASAA
jgi:hypothetical protein